MQSIWQKFYNDDGVLLYEGETINGKAYGTGTSYYPNGNPLHEGRFGIKGLLSGREYYPNGQIRFEGEYCVNEGYGPNWPRQGTWYSENGEILFRGSFHVYRSGLGYPLIQNPVDYGTAYYSDNLGDHLFI